MSAPGDLNASMRVGELDGVGEEIEHDLLHLVRVGLNMEVPLRGRPLVREALRIDQRPCDVLDVGDYVLYRHLSQLVGHLAAAKLQESKNVFDDTQKVQLAPFDA